MLEEADPLLRYTLLFAWDSQKPRGHLLDSGRPTTEAQVILMGRMSPIHARWEMAEGRDRKKMG